MIGDALSDTHANLTNEIGTHYREQLERMPVALRVEVLSLLESIDMARVNVDRWEIGI